MSNPSLFRCLVIEGCDGSGKSTLIEDILHQNSECQMYHAGGPPEDNTEFIQSMIYSLDFIRECKNENCIPVFDRCRPISEMVYGPIVRGRQYFSDRVLKDWLREMKPLIIYMNTPFDIVWERSKSLKVKDHKVEKHVKFVRENIAQIHQSYVSLMRELDEEFTILRLTSPHDSSRVRELVSCVG